KFTADPDDPGRKGGVSIAIHKGMIDVKNITHRAVIPGRVILIEVPWNENDRLRVMNVYAPAKSEEKAAFWKLLWDAIENDDSLRPDVMLGDLNLVENPEIDRLNGGRGTDPQAARLALSELVTELNLADGWRRRHPTKRGYTFTGNGQSRLDRIYTKEDIYPWCTDWKIEHPGFKTDHNMVSVQITSENMPFIGRGRWAIPTNLLKHKLLKKQIQELAMKMQADVERAPRDRATTSPQMALKTFKTEAVRVVRDYQKTRQPRLENAIKSLQKELE
ncbi:Endonuclease/exonuclease/phosphatase, partial [Thelephora terrestris]